MTTVSRIELGARGEQVAVDYLQALGLCVLQRNWRCRYGELDIIAAENQSEDRATAVFVEVKSRTGDGFGGLPEAVTPVKVRRIRRLAGLWLAGQERRWAGVRIDVVGVRFGRPGGPEVSYLRGVG